MGVRQGDFKREGQNRERGKRNSGEKDPDKFQRKPQDEEEEEDEEEDGQWRRRGMSRRSGRGVPTI